MGLLTETSPALQAAADDNARVITTLVREIHDVGALVGQLQHTLGEVAGVQAGAARSAQAAQAMHDIGRAQADVVAAVEAIAHALMLQLAATRTIDTQLDALRTHPTRLAQSSQHTTATAAALANAAAALKRSIDRFHLT
jgi:methyl-accepting chemotaxis protein